MAVTLAVSAAWLRQQAQRESRVEHHGPADAVAGQEAAQRVGAVSAVEDGAGARGTEDGVIVQRTKTYAICPACGADAGCIDHLLGQTLQTMWYCDACGQAYRLMFTNDDGVAVDVSVVEGKRKVATLDMLMLEPQPKPVYFVVEGMRFEGEGDRDDWDAKQFFYEEHSCPTNWFRSTTVAFDGDYDPHGLLTFVATRDESAFPRDESHGPNDRDFAVRAFIEASAAKR